jgi:hypothetical protein
LCTLVGTNRGLDILRLLPSTLLLIYYLLIIPTFESFSVSYWKRRYVYTDILIHTLVCTHLRYVTVGQLTGLHCYTWNQFSYHKSRIFLVSCKVNSHLCGIGASVDSVNKVEGEIMTSLAEKSEVSSWRALLLE